MEEILASIRRIIADDQEVLRGASRDRHEPSGLANVLDLTERHTAQMAGRSVPLGQAYATPELAEGSSDHRDDVDHSENDLQLVSYHDEPEDAPDHVAEPDEAEHSFSDPRRADTLLSSAANASVADAFTRLGATIMPTQPQTLEDLMKDLLRPMLKAWLDENLPTLVERLVQAEIERIARRR